jgi:hypothetical protein
MQEPFATDFGSISSWNQNKDKQNIILSVKITQNMQKKYQIFKIILIIVSLHNQCFALDNLPWQSGST